MVLLSFAPLSRKPWLAAKYFLCRSAWNLHFGLARSYPVIFECTVALHEVEFDAKAQARNVGVGIYLTPLASALVEYGYEFGEHHFLVGTSHNR